MSVPRTYTIRTIADLAALPPSSLPRCLKEIEGVLTFHRTLLNATGAVADIEAIHWTDDGKDEIRGVIVKDSQGREATIFAEVKKESGE